MESHTSISLMQLQEKIDDTWANGKVPFFFDSTGNAITFLNYSSVVVEVAKLQISIAMGTSVDDVKEDMRIKFIGAMATGQPLVFFLDKVAGKFNTDYFDSAFIPKCIFDPAEITKYDTYMKCVRDDENVDMFGGKGNFMMKDGFKVVVVSTRDVNDEDNHQYGERMPLDNMQFFVIS